MGDYFGDGLPAEIKADKDFLIRGKQRYGIYCAICHADSGNGNGPVRSFGPNGGQIPIANLHDAKFSDPENPEYRPDGEMFNIITKGRGLMGPYGGAIPAKDRWAIIAYVRALQDAKITAAKEKENKAKESEAVSTEQT
ncbi:MAG: cytochrome c [Akkermansiaceae bacterium]|nr:cytochrome c [Akkermansiaceae bacterium]